MLEKNQGNRFEIIHNPAPKQTIRPLMQASRIRGLCYTQMGCEQSELPAPTIQKTVLYCSHLMADT